MTRVAGKGYVFAYNTSNATVSATFTWHRTPSTVTVNAEGRTLSLSGSQFTDSFAAHEAHVYVIEEPSLTVAFAAPADGASVQGTVTVTAVATGGASGYVYTLSSDGAPIAGAGTGSAAWDTWALANGPHTLAASVTDGAGDTATATITVTIANVPSAPTALTATAASGPRVNLAWADASSNESGFKIERSTDGVTFTQIGTVTAEVIAYADTTVVAGVTYRYRVRAFNAVGDSSYSNTAEAATVPVAPTSLTLTVASASRVDVAWTDGSSNESGFKIERSRNGGAFTQVATVAANITTYADTHSRFWKHLQLPRPRLQHGRQLRVLERDAREGRDAVGAQHLDGNGGDDGAPRQPRVARQRDERKRLRDLPSDRHRYHVWDDCDRRPQRRGVFRHHRHGKHELQVPCSRVQRRRRIELLEHHQGDRTVNRQGVLHHAFR